MENKTTDEPHCSFQELLNIKSGVTILSGSISGLIGNLFAKNLLTEIDEVLKLIKDVFKDKFYLEIQRHNDVGEKLFEDFMIIENEYIKNKRNVAKENNGNQ